MEQDRGNVKVLNLGARPVAGEELPYGIELWDAVSGKTVERVLARAAGASLARAIFKAASGEYPERRVTLRLGARVIADSEAG